MEVDIFRLFPFVKGKISKVVKRGTLIHGRKYKSGSISTLPVKKNIHTCSDKVIRLRAFPVVFLNHDAENTTIHITSPHAHIAFSICLRCFLRTCHIGFFLRAFAFFRFHFFSAAAAAAVFDEIDLRVLFLFSMKADPLRKHASKIQRVLVTKKLKER